MRSCAACGMPLDNPADCAAASEPGDFCIHCVGSDGKVKPCREIFDGGVAFFMGALSGTDRALAERLVRKNMNRLPHWQRAQDPCLRGEEATDAEFTDALGRL